jgi:crossover junction endodeoxyribonuclease RuvC
MCLLVGGEAVFLDDIPVGVDKNGKTQILVALLASTVRELAPDLIVLEQVGAMPKNGVAGMFRFGQGHGIIIGVAAALSIPLHLVTAPTWKKPFGLVGSEKDEARMKVMREVPALASRVARKKDIGRADAFWLARYGEKFL